MLISITGREYHERIAQNQGCIVQEEEPVAAKYPLQGCCVRLASEEDLRRAYDLLNQGGKGKLLQDAGWTSLIAWVTDQYSISWMLCV
jgi:uncharacterized glyoxalase superfamily protein PhnB